MHRIIWLLTLRFSALLMDTNEREVVLGDLEERGLAGEWRGLMDVLALIGARQIPLWRSWRPWVALLTLSLPAAGMVGCAGSIAGILSRFPWPKDPVFTPQLVASITFWAVVAIILWAWSAGFALSKIAGRASIGVVPIIGAAALIGSGCLWSGGLGCVVAAIVLVAVPAVVGWRRPLSFRWAVAGAIVFAVALWFVFREQNRTDYGGPLANVAIYTLFLWPTLVPLAATTTKPLAAITSKMRARDS